MAGELNVRWVANVADLRGLTGATYPAVFVEGYTNAGDGGGGHFYVSTDTTSLDNGATIIIASDGSRYYRIWEGQPFNVLWAGADPTSTSSSDTAFSTSASVSSILYVPVGKYKLSNQFAYTIPSGVGAFTIIGDGAEASVLYFPNNSGISVTYNSSIETLVHIRDLSITAGLANSGIGITLTFSSASNINRGFTDIAGVKIRGDDGVATYCWNDAIQINGTSNVNITGVSITGALNFVAIQNNGVVINGNSVGSIVYTISDCIIDNVYTGLVYGNHVQGVLVTNTQFTNCFQGIFVPSGQTGLDELTVTGCQLSMNGSSILANTLLGNVQIANNVFGFTGTPAANTGMVQGMFTNLTVVGNSFGGTLSSGSQIGLNIISGPTGVITGNTFIFVGTGVMLGSGTNHYNLQSNSYNAVGQSYINSGTSNTVAGGSP